MSDPLEALHGGLVVSVQAPDGSPVAGSSHIAALARAAELGGAAGIRAVEIAAVKEAVGLPVIGLRKRRVEGSEVYITPELSDARAVAAAGADIVAVDATLRPRPDGVDLTSLVSELPVPVLADVDTLEAGVAAWEAGAAAVATTLAGYTGGAAASAASPPGGPSAEPDLELVSALATELDCPVFAEGRIATPGHVREAFEAGAFAVVVGTAITDPVALTRGFAAAARGSTHAAR
ncbi:MAG TPA: putative N-acetylmannosamine-6-phosphate 2-epimerase [Thermoleophilaceae bacterium]|nr:putative N-acetylmannosamine-6-phosphate 2-epimerase [Thermoleophilaceae bacterium]